MAFFEPKPLIDDTGYFRTTDVYVAAYIYYRTGESPLLVGPNCRRRTIEFPIKPREGLKYEQEWFKSDTQINCAEWFSRLLQIKQKLKDSNYDNIYSSDDKSSDWGGDSDS